MWKQILGSPKAYYQTWKPLRHSCFYRIRPRKSV